MVAPVDPPPGISPAQPEQWPATRATKLRWPFRRQRAVRVRYTAGSCFRGGLWTSQPQLSVRHT
eukprot:9533375-Lingulodinium_polyedra.AAC.1